MTNKSEIDEDRHEIQNVEILYDSLFRDNYPDNFEKYSYFVVDDILRNVNLEDIIRTLNYIKEYLEDIGYFNIKISGSSRISHNLLTLYGDRYETDKEKNKRLKRNEIEKKRTEEELKSKERKERKEYERLKKKFEGKNNG